MRTSSFALTLALTLLALSGCSSKTDSPSGTDDTAAPVDTESSDDSDQDGDGVTAEDGDCNDQDPSIYPGASDSAGDGVDQNCDGTDGVDADGDGWASDVSGGEDCDDDDAESYPGANDSVGDNTDQNCDGLDGVDADNDGTASEASGGDDCNDNDSSVYVGAADPYGDGADQNCDGTDGVDADGDGWASSAGGGEDCDDSDPSVYPGVAQMEPLLCTMDADMDGYGDSSAMAPVEAGTDCDDADATEFPGADEYCDGDDDDCDGQVDEDESVDALTFYADSDSDGYGDASVSQIDCYPVSGYVMDDTDCDDTDSSEYPGAPETCDGDDDDCDGDVDEDSATDALTWYADSDSDGYGDASVTDVECYQPTGYVANSTDCDDTDGTLNLDDADSDGYSTCDGDCDDSDSSLELSDSDGDGYSTCDGDCDDTDGTLNLDDADADGYSSCDGDCDDTDSSLYPGTCYEDYAVYISYSDLVGLYNNCSNTHTYNNCNGTDYGFEWTDAEGGTPSSIDVEFYSGINCFTYYGAASSQSASTELNSVSTGSVTLQDGGCTCSPTPTWVSLTLTDISGFVPNGTNTFLIESVDPMGCDGISEDSSVGAYAIVNVSY